MQFESKYKEIYNRIQRNLNKIGRVIHQCVKFLNYVKFIFIVMTKQLYIYSWYVYESISFQQNTLKSYVIPTPAGWHV